MKKLKKKATLEIIEIIKDLRLKMWDADAEECEKYAIAIKKLMEGLR